MRLQAAIDSNQILEFLEVGIGIGICEWDFQIRNQNRKTFLLVSRLDPRVRNFTSTNIYAISSEVCQGTITRFESTHFILFLKTIYSQRRRRLAILFKHHLYQSYCSRRKMKAAEFQKVFKDSRSYSIGGLLRNGFSQRQIDPTTYVKLFSYLEPFSRDSTIG